jgi:hypothetical protein
MAAGRTLHKGEKKRCVCVCMSMSRETSLSECYLFYFIIHRAEVAASEMLKTSEPIAMNSLRSLDLPSSPSQAPRKKEREQQQEDDSGIGSLSTRSHFDRHTRLDRPGRSVHFLSQSQSRGSYHRIAISRALSACRVCASQDISLQIASAVVHSL